MVVKAQVMSILNWLNNAIYRNNQNTLNYFSSVNDLCWCAGASWDRRLSITMTSNGKGKKLANMVALLYGYILCIETW